MEEVVADAYLRLLEGAPEKGGEENLPPMEEDSGDLEDPYPAKEDSVGRYLREIGSYPLLTLEEEVELARKIQEGQEAARRLGELLGLEADLLLAVARARVNDRQETPAYARLEALSPERVEEVEGRARSSREGKRLYLLVREGEEARRRMVLANLRLVVSVTKRFARGARGLTFLDLIQEGNLGLLRATASFDWRREHKFSTYATWWIRQAVSRALHDQNRIIRLPVHANENLARLQKARADLLRTLEREPTEAELAWALGGGWTPEKVADLLSQAVDTFFLDAPVAEDRDGEPGSSLGDLLGTEALSPARSAEERALRERLALALERLGPREAMVVKLRFGLDGHPPATLEKVGAYLGITRERARQLEVQALRKLGELFPDLREFLEG